MVLTGMATQVRTGGRDGLHARGLKVRSSALGHWRFFYHQFSKFPFAPPARSKSDYSWP